MKNLVKRYWKRFTATNKLVSIAPFRYGRKAALAITFDDGSQDHFDIATPLLNSFGFKGTFFILPGLTREKRSDSLVAGSALDRWGGVCWEEFQQMHRMGHEIANHSWNHQKLPTLDAEKLEKDITDSSEIISKKIGATPVSFAYPWNIWDERVRQVVLKKHRFSRDSQQLAFGAANTSIESFTKSMDLSIRNRQRLIAMVHGIDIGAINPKRTYTVTEDFFTDFLKELKKRESDIWVDTFGNLGRYELYVQSGKVKMKKLSDKAIILDILNLDGVQDPDVSFGPTLAVRVGQGKKISRVEGVSPSGKTNLMPYIHQGEGEFYLDLPKNCRHVEINWAD